MLWGLQKAKLIVLIQNATSFKDCNSTKGSTGGRGRKKIHGWLPWQKERSRQGIKSSTQACKEGTWLVASPETLREILSPTVGICLSGVRKKSSGSKYITVNSSPSRSPLLPPLPPTCVLRREQREVAGSHALDEHQYCVVLL